MVIAGQGEWPLWLIWLGFVGLEDDESVHEPELSG
jgi:hypothetical protein